MTEAQKYIVKKAFNGRRQRFAEGAETTEAGLADARMTLDELKAGGFVEEAKAVKAAKAVPEVDAGPASPTPKKTSTGKD